VEGAYTGEVSGAMLHEAGCRYVIVGHSERRRDYRETDADVAEKAAAALREGLCPIVCVGEDAGERARGQQFAVVERQLAVIGAVLGAAGLKQCVLAYEPVWAIGTGVTATPGQAQEVHAFLRTQLRALDATIADEVRILYGGSVRAGNARELFAQPDIDGALIGGASLSVDEFVAICMVAEGT
jgi:triosephosphate isomerase